MSRNVVGLIMGVVAAIAFLNVAQGGFGFSLIALVALVIIAVSAKKLLQPNGVEGISRYRQHWEEAGRELGLKTLPRTKQGSISTMRGEIDGHRVNVKCRLGGEPEIEVRFESGLRTLDIDPRRRPVGSGGSAEVVTGDLAFDEAYRVRSNPTVDERELMGWLTPERREILVVLGDALAVEEIEEDELEVRLGRSEWTPAELVQAVQLCVLVAKILDGSHVARRRLDPQDALLEDTQPQDAVRPSFEARQDHVIQDAPRPDDFA